jgi:hypothetical protein
MLNISPLQAAAAVRCGPEVAQVDIAAPSLAKWLAAAEVRNLRSRSRPEPRIPWRLAQEALAAFSIHQIRSTATIPYSRTLPQRRAVVAVDPMASAAAKREEPEGLVAAARMQQQAALPQARHRDTQAAAAVALQVEWAVEVVVQVQ